MRPSVIVPIDQLHAVDLLSLPKAWRVAFLRACGWSHHGGVWFPCASQPGRVLS